MNISTIFILCGGIACMVVPLILMMTVKPKPLKIVTIVLLLLYCVVLLIGVWGKLDIGWDTCHITFDWTYNWCAKTINWHPIPTTTFDFVINLIMLIPIGMALFVLLPQHKGVLSIIIGFLIGFLIECSQFVLPIYRSVQLSDVLLNMMSVAFGCLIGWIYDKITKK